MSGTPASVADLAAACAERLPRAPRSFADDREGCARELDALLAAVRASALGFVFDAEGRPDAIDAVRHALPASEAQLLDAILDDVACELAAWQEALYRVALAARERPSNP